jgi:hypothetical protein
MSQQGFATLTAQQIYNRHKIVTPDDARAIARVLNLGSEPFNPQAVEAILAFAQEARALNLSVKQAISQAQGAAATASKAVEQQPETGSEPPEAGSLATHLQSLLNQAATHTQEQLEQLDQIIYEQVELPAAQAAVDRILLADRNIEQLMLKLLPAAIAQRPGRLGGMVLQAVGQFRAPTLEGTEQRYALSAGE